MRGWVGVRLLAGIPPPHLLSALQKEERETEAKSLKCEALSGVSIVIALEYFNEVLIADDVHCHAGVGGGSIQVVDLRQLVC